MLTFGMNQQPTSPYVSHRNRTAHGSHGPGLLVDNRQDTEDTLRHISLETMSER